MILGNQRLSDVGLQVSAKLRVDARQDRELRQSQHVTPSLTSQGGEKNMPRVLKTLKHAIRAFSGMGRREVSSTEVYARSKATVALLCTMLALWISLATTVGMLFLSNIRDGKRWDLVEAGGVFAALSVGLTAFLLFDAFRRRGGGERWKLLAREIEKAGWKHNITVIEIDNGVRMFEVCAFSADNTHRYVARAENLAAAFILLVRQLAAAKTRDHVEVIDFDHDFRISTQTDSETNPKP